MKSSYFADLEEIAPKQSKSSYFSDLEPSNERSPSVEDYIEAPVRGFGAQVLGLPRTISGLLKHGSKALAGKGRQLAEEEGREITPEQERFTSFVTEALSKPDEWLQKIGAMTPEEITKLWRAISEGVPEEQLQELTGAEQGLETFGSFLGAGVNPASAFTKGGLLGAAGAGIASGLGGEEGAQLGAAIGLPAVIEIANIIKNKKISPSSVKGKALYRELKNAGLSEEEITPIIQGKFKSSLIGPLAQPTKRATSKIEASESALGRIYDKAKDKASKIAPATPAQEDKLILKMNGVLDEMRKSKVKSPGKKAAIEEIEHMIADVASNGISADEIIATSIEINDIIDWNSIKNGKKSLAKVKKPLSDLLKEMDPKVYNDFKLANHAWGKLQDTAQYVKPTSLTKYVTLGEASALLPSLYQMVTTGQSKFLAGFLGVKGARLLATEMLTNPRLNNLVNKTLAASSKGTKGAVNKAARDFVDGLKDYPEIYENLDLYGDNQ